MIALVYLRVSTEEQAEKGYSIQVQRTEGIRKAVELGCSREEIFVFCDEGVSGVLLERPQLMAALELLKKSKDSIKYFICYDSSRLSRNASHQLIIIDEIKKSNGKLVFLKNSYQDNAEGRFQLTVMAAVDEYERARLKLRTEMGKRAKAAQHKLTHNPGLYGYDFDPVTDTLSINEENAQNIRLIFKMFTEDGKRPAEIAKELNKSEIPSPRMRQWSRVTVSRILANPSYLGTLHIRRYDTRDCHLNKYRKKGEKIKVREKPESEWIPVKIPVIIDRNIWEKAQNILGDLRHFRKRASSGDFLLADFLKCGLCGSWMKGKSVRKGSSSYRYYVCAGKYRDTNEKRCKAALLKADKMEETVWNYINKSICSFAAKESDLEKIIEEFISEKEKEKKNILRKIEKAKNERERVITMFQKGYISEEEMRKKLSQCEKRAEYISDKAVGSRKYSEEYIGAIKNAWKRDNLPHIIEEMLNRLDPEDKKGILKLLISGIYAADKKIVLKGKFI